MSRDGNSALCVDSRLDRMRGLIVAVASERVLNYQRDAFNGVDVVKCVRILG